MAIGCREVYLINAIQLRKIAFFMDKIKEAVREMELPFEYDIRVYKNVYRCCGIGGLGVVIEMAGPEERMLRAIDLRVVSKIMEFCEDERLGLGEHTLEKCEIT